MAKVPGSKPYSRGIHFGFPRKYSLHNIHTTELSVIRNKIRLCYNIALSDLSDPIVLEFPCAMHMHHNIPFLVEFQLLLSVVLVLSWSPSCDSDSPWSPAAKKGDLDLLLRLLNK